MNMETFENKEPNESQEIPFVLDKSRENVDVYIFDHVAVVVDRRGKNVKDMPELHFGTFADEPNNDMFNQPEDSIEGVDMEYVTQCIRTTLAEDGESAYWLHPYSKDVDQKKKERRKEARMRLFSRYAEIEPDSKNFGYIIRV